MPTFNVWRELGGGTTKRFNIRKMPERLIQGFDRVDLRTEHEREHDVELNDSEQMIRGLYCFFWGTSI